MQRATAYRRNMRSLLLGWVLSNGLVGCSLDDEQAALRDKAAASCSGLEPVATLPRPPEDRLPCELIPPGLALED